MIPPENEEWNGVWFPRFFYFLLFFFQLKYYLDEHEEIKSDDVNYDLKYSFHDFDNSSEKFKARRQQYYFSTSSICNNNSLMLPKLRHKNLVQILFGCRFHVK